MLKHRYSIFLIYQLIMMTQISIPYSIPQEKKIMLIYHDEQHQLEPMTQKIQQHMKITSYCIDTQSIPEASLYDLILIGDSEGMSEEMEVFLQWYDFKGSKVSFYSTKTIEEERVHVKNATLCHGLFLQQEEIEDENTLESMINGWLTSTYTYRIP